MVTKLQSISHLKMAINYCDRGGELLYSHKCLGSTEDIYQQMMENNALNDRCIKKSFHIKIRIAPEDKGILNNQDWIDISKKYADKIGFADNPYAIYIHLEGTPDKTHIHIVASRIKENNRAVKDNYTHYKNLDFSREIEKTYNLRKVKRVMEQLKKQEVFIKDNSRLPPLKEKIKLAIQNSNNMDEFIQHLKKNKVIVKRGRGISFTDEKGASFKGSQIDRKLSLKGIEKILKHNLLTKTQNLSRNLYL